MERTGKGRDGYINNSCTHVQMIPPTILIAFYVDSQNLGSTLCKIT